MFHMPYVMYIFNVRKIPSTLNGIEQNREISVLIRSTTWNVLKNGTWSQQTRKHIYRFLDCFQEESGSTADESDQLKKQLGAGPCMLMFKCSICPVCKQAMHTLNVKNIPSPSNGIEKDRDIGVLIHSATWNLLENRTWSQQTRKHTSLQKHSFLDCFHEEWSG